MSVKGRVTKIEHMLAPEIRRKVMTRREFEKRVEGVKLGLSKFGIVSAEALARRITIERLSKSPSFAGFDFDPMVH